MTKPRTATALEVLAAIGLQYGLARLLGRMAAYAEEHEERELTGLIPTQREPAETAVRV